MNACMNCKSELAADHRFCPRCGTPASKDLEQYMLARSAMEGRMEGGPVQPAIASLEKAYKMGLRDAHVLCGLGILYYRLGDITLATKYLEEAIALKPNFPEAHYDLALTYYRGGQIHKTIATMQRCLELSPDYAAAHYWIGIANYHLGRQQKAIESFLRVVELNPESKAANYHLGVNFASLGQYDKAIAHFKLVVENCPEDEAAFYHLGMAYYESNKIPEAIAIFRHCGKLDAGDRRAAQMLEMLTEVPGV
jgi:protein O-GlcNAc transferase